MKIANEMPITFIIISCQIILLMTSTVNCLPAEFDVLPISKETESENLINSIITTQTTPTDPTDPTDSSIVQTNREVSSENVSPTGQDEKCGINNLPNEIISVRITSSGNDTEANEFPWMVILILETERDGQLRNLYQGGGSIISSSIVLTVAHRVRGKSLDKLKVRAGEWNVLNKEEFNPSQDRAIKKMIIHKNFKISTLINNVALLILEKPFQLNVNIRPICLPSAQMTFHNITCTVSGWGKNKFKGKYESILRKIDLPIIEHDNCQNLLRKTKIGSHFTLNKSFLCAGGESDKDACIGDGGSPLVCQIDERYYQAGIVAAGIGCGADGIPGLYTNIAYMRSWIDEQVTAEGFDKSSYQLKNLEELA